MTDLSQSTAIVTGGASGIGRACVMALSQNGARVVFTYHSEEDTAQDIAGKTGAIPVQTDVADEDAVASLFARCEKEFGAPTLLVNSAGLNMSGTCLVDMELSHFDKVVRTDLYGPFLTCRAFARMAKAGGRIVNISSIHEDAPRGGAVDYDAAKGGLAQLTATLALELAPRRIAVNGVAPGMILTPMNAEAMDDEEVRRKAEANIPWGRAGTPEEVAALVVFLLSPAADYITGATVTIDGALSQVVAPGA
ncbi:SDR family NAD(P)-dependent oxidoreductase [Croceicoccus hydrothermalis]|uniref:SDR family NAD(P)-dependent oxidoreductase n=1 Tax=Croceicoccus hydrothermalis TaxID=2867964 RepID=UPI001EFA6860|nr:SDR family oxidoreductase [Croceicoccus hydrothermalis]